MKNTDKGTKGIAVRLAAALLVAVCTVFLWQPAALKADANQLGSHGGGAVGGDVGGEDTGGGDAGEAGAEAPEGGDDAVVNQIIGENQEEEGGATTVASVTIKPKSARVRSEASVNSSVAGSLSSGDTVPVVGQTTGSDGMTWYQIATEKDGKAVNGYVREDLVDIAETVQPSEAPAEDPAQQQPETQTPDTSQDYYVQYADDGTGVSDWYLNDTANGTRYKVSELLNAQKTNASNAELMEGQTSKFRLIIIILAVVIVLLVIVVTVMILKLKGSYDNGYADDEDDEDDDYPEEDEDEDETDDEDDDEEDEEDDEYYSRKKKRKPFGRKKPLKKKPSRKRIYDEDDDDDDEDDDEDDEYYGDEEDDEDEEDDDMMYEGEVSYRESRSASKKKSSPGKAPAKSKKAGWQSKNFLDTDDDDDLDFEFLDLK